MSSRISYCGYALADQSQRRLDPAEVGLDGDYVVYKTDFNFQRER